MNPMARAVALLETKLGRLERRLRDGDETALGDYCLVAQTLAAVSAHAAPGAGGKLVSTKELGTLMGLSSKTLLRRKAKGQIKGAVQLEGGSPVKGKHGSAVRWDVSAAVSRAGR